MADNLKFLEREILNKVLNAGEDALNVDLTAGGSAMLVDDAAFTPGTSTVQMIGAEFDDSAPDSVNEGDAGAIRMSANRNLYTNIRDAAGNERGVNVDSSNQLLVVEASASAIATDAAAIEVLLTAANADHAANEVLLGTIDADTNAIKGHVDGIETLITSTNTKLDTLETTLTAMETDDAAIEVLLTAANVDHAANEVLLTGIDSDTDAIKTDMAAIEVLLTSANVDHAANEVLLGTIDADTNAIKVDMAAIEVLLTAANVDHAANEVLLGTIDSDTNDIKTATESSNTHLGNMFYDTALAVTPSDGSDLTGEPFYAVYVGTGGNLKVDMADGGAAVTLSNVASGQLLPIMVERIYATGTTASNIIAFK
jgi:hypothetical protein